MKIRIPVYLLLSAFLGASQVGQAGEFWQEKGYRQWSQKECRKMLENSPWAKRYTLSGVYIVPVSEASPAPERRTNPWIRYLVQFHSALPVRQALVRWSQLASDYETMSPEQRQEFDAQAERYLAASFPEIVLLNVGFSSNTQEWLRDLDNYWKKQTTETLRNFVFLIAHGGEKIPLLQYVPPRGGSSEFQLAFPRRYQGKPILIPEDKAIKLELPPPPMEPGHPDRRHAFPMHVLVEFKVKKMLVDGKLVY